MEHVCLKSLADAEKKKKKPDADAHKVKVISKVQS